MRMMMVMMVKAGEWGGGTCVCVFRGGKVDFMCAYANGQAVQGNWLKVILVKVLSKLAKVSARKPTEPHRGPVCLEIFCCQNT